MNQQEHTAPVHVLLLLAYLALGIPLEILGIPPADAANVATGRVIYEKNCQVCHGHKGKGDGYRALNPPPADLTAPSVQRKDNAELAQTIAHGHPNTAMGRWEVELSEGDIQHLVGYLRTLAQ